MDIVVLGIDLGKNSCSVAGQNAAGQVAGVCGWWKQMA